MLDDKVQPTSDRVSDLVGLHSLEWNELSTRWLAAGSRAPKTVRTYQGALKKYNAWCARERIDPLRVTRPQIDSFINFLRMDGKLSEATVRLTVWWIGSLYDWMQHGDGGHNPFRGVVVEPKELKGEAINLPSPEEVIRIIRALEPLDSLVVAFLSCTGAPAGSLPEVSFHGKNFAIVFRGRVITGQIPELVAVLLRTIPREIQTRPFAHRTAAQWSNHIWKLLDRRSRSTRNRPVAVVSTGYSLRDFQYFWVLQNWPQSHDLTFFKDRLGLGSVTKVQSLLKRLGLNR